jgi:hypothetical protein
MIAKKTSNIVLRDLRYFEVLKFDLVLAVSCVEMSWGDIEDVSRLSWK